MTPDRPSASSTNADRSDPNGGSWEGWGPFELVHGPDDLDAESHAALGPAMLRAASGKATNMLRCYQPPPTAAFTGLDRLAPGYRRACDIALDQGFEPVRRGVGGRMAAYHQKSLCLDVVVADAASPAPALDPWKGLAALAAVLVALLRRVGVDARVGEVPGEYCPGRFSVNVDGRFKVAGTAARRISGATLLSAVLLVDDVEPVRAVTTEVYAALPFPMRPETVAGAADYVPGLTVHTLTQEFLTLAASRIELVEGVIAPRLRALTG